MALSGHEHESLNKAIARCTDQLWASQVADAWVRLTEVSDSLLLSAFEIRKGNINDLVAKFSGATADFLHSVQSRSAKVGFQSDPVRPEDKVSELLLRDDYRDATFAILGNSKHLTREFLIKRIQYFAGTPFKTGRVEEQKDLLRSLVSALREKTKSKKGFCSKALDASLAYYGAWDRSPVNRPAAMVLIEEGADLQSGKDYSIPGEPDTEGNMLLHYLAFRIRPDRALIKAILKAGFPADARNAVGLTFVDLLPDKKCAEWGQALYEKYAKHSD